MTMKRFIVSVVITLIMSGLVLMSSQNAQAQTGVRINFFPWDWDVTIEPVGAAPVPGAVEIPVWGAAEVDFDDSQVPGGLGTQDLPLVLPPGETFTIPIEIVSLELRSMGPVRLPGLATEGTVVLRLGNRNDNFNAEANRGEIQVRNEGGVLVGDSFFDVFIDVELISEDGEEPMQLTTNPDTPWRLGMQFDAEDNIPAIDVFWLPSWFWLNGIPGRQLPLPPELIAASGLWDVIVDAHGHITAEPPEVDCIETVNPHGKKIPPAGSTTPPGPKGGKNDDGFYELLSDDPNVRIFVWDANASGPFGPFSSGDKVKITEAPGTTPRMKPMGSSNGQAGAIAAHILLTADAQVTAINAAGMMATTTCFVPPPPK
jgi:hypothetical protein